MEGTTLHEATKRHADSYALAQRHAKRCRACYKPIIDDEGNPGLFSEACKIGAKLLREYIAAEGALLHG